MNLNADSEGRPEAGFEALEHTADLRMRAWAPELRGLIEQALRGMIRYLLEAPLAPTSRVEVSGQGENAEEVLVDCLRETLLLPELEDLMPVTAEVLDADERGARCSIGVVPVEQASGRRGEDIKAVTYHDLRIRPVGRHLQVEVVFDV